MKIIVATDDGEVIEEIHVKRGGPPDDPSEDTADGLEEPPLYESDGDWISEDVMLAVKRGFEHFPNA